MKKKARGPSRWTCVGCGAVSPPPRDEDGLCARCLLARHEQEVVVSNKLETIPVTDIAPSALNPRKFFAETDLDELAASLRQDGVLQPLVVRPWVDDPDGDGRANGAARTSEKRFELIAGERRWRAAQRAGLETVPAVVRTDLDDVAVLRLMLVENVQRADLRPIEEADACQAVLDAAPGTGMDDLAELVGRSVSWIYQRLQLRKLTPAGRASVEAGRLSAGHATEIARLQPDDQERALIKCDFHCRDDVVQSWEQELSLRGLEEWIKNNIPLSRRNPAQAAKGVPIVLGHYLPGEGGGKFTGKEERKKILLHRDFELVREPCEHTIDGVVWLGSKAGAIKPICPRRSRCKKHWGAVFAAEKKERERTKKWNADRRKEAAGRQKQIAERDRLDALLTPRIEAALQAPPAFTPALARLALRLLYQGLKWRIHDDAEEVEAAAAKEADWWPLLLRAALYADGSFDLAALARRGIELRLLNPADSLEAHPGAAGDADAESRADVCTADEEDDEGAAEREQFYESAEANSTGDGA